MRVIRWLFFTSIILLGISCQMDPQSSPQPYKENSPLPQTHSPSSLYLPITSVGERRTPTPFQPVTPTIAPTALPSGSNPAGQPAMDRSAEIDVPPPIPLLSDDETVNFLLIGSDRRSGRSFRTDTLIVMSLRYRQNAVTLLSIPRDLYVYIPGWMMQRINTAYQHGELEGYPGGGSSLLKETILYNLGIRVDHIAIVDFDGFRNAIDILGGIDVPLSCPFTDWRIIDPNDSDQDPENWNSYTIGPGLVHMDGDLALWYARSRQRSNDFDRARRQQQILRAVHSRARMLKVIPRIPELYKKMSQSVVTDMTISDALTFVPIGLNMKADSIRSYYINDQFVRPWKTSTGEAVLLPRRKRIKELILKAMASPSQEESLRQKSVVEIWDLTVDQDLAILAAERLHYAGFSTQIASPVVPASAPDQTTLFHFNTDNEDKAANALLAVLGLPPGRLVEAHNSESKADYRLILREDYDPCFNPAHLVH